MANTLTNLIPTILLALNSVSRELVGLTPAVYRNSSAERAAKDETIRYPITSQPTLEAITPAATPADSGDEVVDSDTMTIDNVYAAPVRITGEETKGLRNAALYEALMQERFAQSFRALANAVELTLAGLYVGASRAYGTPGTTPFAASLADAMAVGKILDDNGCPASDRVLVIDTAAALAMKSLSNYTQVMAAGGDYKARGILMDLNGFTIRQSAQIKAHTPAAEAAYITNGTFDIGDTTVSVDGAGGTDDVLAGDVLTFVGDTNKYVVKTGLANLAAGDIVLGRPGLRAALADGVAFSTAAAYRANLAFHKMALHLVTRTPAMPDGGDSADDSYMVTDPVSGLTFEVRVYRQYHRVKYEVCLAWGAKVVKPENLAILLG